MFSKIMVPVDLAHADRLAKAITIASAVARADNAELVYVGVTPPTPSGVAHNPREFAAKLDAFAATEKAVRNLRITDHVVISHDPSIDLGERLVEAARDMNADLVVMASHLPGLADHIFHSNAGYVAAHAPCSVYVIR